MHHVIFEVLPAPGGREPYLAIAARLKPMMEASGGCLALERFERDDGSGWMLSMQRWADEAALERWRAHGDHCTAQRAGRERIFADYRLRVATRLGHRATREVEVGVGSPSSALAGGAARALAVLEWSGDASVVQSLGAAPAGSLRWSLCDNASVACRTSAPGRVVPSRGFIQCRVARCSAVCRPMGPRLIRYRV